MTTYERVTYRPQEGRRARAVFLENVTASDRFLSGIEVDKNGELVTGVGFDERVRVIELALVVSRVPYVLDRVYDELMKAD